MYAWICYECEKNCTVLLDEDSKPQTCLFPSNDENELPKIIEKFVFEEEKELTKLETEIRRLQSDLESAKRDLKSQKNIAHHFMIN